jgi:hypothetical protein
MASPTVRRVGKPCRHCRRFFRAKSNHKRQVYCGRRCAALARPRASRVAAGRKGGRAGAEKRRGLRREQIRRRVADLAPTAAWLDGVKWGQRRLAARVQSARREGYSAGYEAAIEAMTRMEKTA